MSEEVSRASLMAMFFKQRAHRPSRSPRFDRVEDIFARCGDHVRDERDDRSDKHAS